MRRKDMQLGNNGGCLVFCLLVVTVRARDGWLAVWLLATWTVLSNQPHREHEDRS